MLVCPARMGPVLRYSKDKETSILHYLMFNCETQIVVLGALKILYYQRRYRQTSTLTHEEKKNTENFKIIRPLHTLCSFPFTLYLSLSLSPSSLASLLPLSPLSEVFDSSVRFDLRESEFCKHIFHDHIATGKGSARRGGRRRSRGRDSERKREREGCV